MSIREVLKSGKLQIGLTRLAAKCHASFGRSSENGYKQMQYMWKYTLRFLPKLEKSYNIAISYLWPHYFVAEKVKATTKIAWIHTEDRKSTRLNSSHVAISYAVFCLKKKKKKYKT